MSVFSKFPLLKEYSTEISLFLRNTRISSKRLFRKSRFQLKWGVTKRISCFSTAVLTNFTLRDQFSHEISIFTWKFHHSMLKIADLLPVKIDKSYFNSKHLFSLLPPTANLLNFMYGLSIAWFIATGNTFHTDATPLLVPPITRAEVKWIDSSLYVGGFVGVIFLTLMGDGFGRKNTLAVMIFPQVVNSNKEEKNHQIVSVPMSILLFERN